MPSALTEDQEHKLLSLPIVVPRQFHRTAASLLDHLLEMEAARLGLPDKTGAIQPLALTQGSLLQPEFDLSVHGHPPGWQLGAVIVDVRGTIHLNMKYGFKGGDLALKSVVSALKAAFPTGKVVRSHSDAFAVLLPPSAERPMSADFRPAAEVAVKAGLSEALKTLDPVAETPELTISLLRLTIERPAHWVVLGPLVWSELERAHVLERQGNAPPIQLRHLDLAATV